MARYIVGEGPGRFIVIERVRGAFRFAVTVDDGIIIHRLQIERLAIDSYLFFILFRYFEGNIRIRSENGWCARSLGIESVVKVIGAFYFFCVGVFLFAAGGE